MVENAISNPNLTNRGPVGKTLHRTSLCNRIQSLNSKHSSQIKENLDVQRAKLTRPFS